MRREKLPPSGTRRQVYLALVLASRKRVFGSTYDWTEGKFNHAITDCHLLHVGSNHSRPGFSVPARELDAFEAEPTPIVPNPALHVASASPPQAVPRDTIPHSGADLIGARASTQANGHSAQWVMNESARLVHVVQDPSVGAALARWANGLNRVELDARLVAPFGNEFLRLFNDPNYAPRHPEPANSILRGIDPSFVVCRDGTKLKEKFAVIRKDFTTSHSNWSVSGQNDPSNFWNFCSGKKITLYAFLVWHNSPAIEMVLRTVNDGT